MAAYIKTPKTRIIPIQISEAMAQFFLTLFLSSLAQMIMKIKPINGIIVIKKLTSQSPTDGVSANSLGEVLSLIIFDLSSDLMDFNAIDRIKRAIGSVKESKRIKSSTRSLE